MMRRKYAVCLILFTLLAVAAGGCERKENNISQQNHTERTTQTEKPAETENPVNFASPTMSEKRIKGVTVIDETGKNFRMDTITIYMWQGR